MVISSSDQFVVVHHNGSALVFVHTCNNYNSHRTLWSDLLSIDDPNICILGDFNVVLGAHECSSGHLAHVAPSEEFRDFISQRDLFDIEGTGNKLLGRLDATMVLLQLVLTAPSRARASLTFWMKLSY